MGFVVYDKYYAQRVKLVDVEFATRLFRQKQ
jgi:hypothetical protein